MKILALEFSAMTRSAAVLDTESDRASSSGVAWAQPHERIHPTTLVDRALSAAGCSRESIERLAIGLGPGSYTGIRMAIALAEGWQLARPVEVVGISSALCLAHQMKQRGHRGPVHIVVDAQRNEYSLGQFLVTPSGVRPLEPLVLIAAVNLAAKVNAGESVAGPDLGERFPGALEIAPDAAMLGRLAADSQECVSAELLQPIYLRPAQFVSIKSRKPPQANSSRNRPHNPRSR